MKKRILSIILSISIVSSLSSNVFAATNSSNNVSNMKMTRQERIKVDSANEITVETYNDNGIIIHALKGKPKDKNKAINYFEDNYLSVGKAEQVVGYDHTNSGVNTGSDSRNSNCRSSTNLNANWDVTFWDMNLYTSGYQSGIMLGSNPYFADMMICNQNYSVNGMSVQGYVSFPPGATLSPDKDSGSWSSEPIYNTYYVTASYPNAHFVSAFGIYSCTFNDSTDMYIGSNIYRPSSSVYLN